eukprot:COSAG06_NODE_6411_length_2944_cov_14.298770_4_plen_104_part_00
MAWGYSLVRISAGKRTGFFNVLRYFVLKSRAFAKTGSGRTYGENSKDRVFLQWRCRRRLLGSTGELHSMLTDLQQLQLSIAVRMLYTLLCQCSLLTAAHALAS